MNRIYTFGRYRLDTGMRELHRGHHQLHLSSQGFDLLVYLVQHCGRVLTKEELARHVWRLGLVSEGAIYFQISGLKRLVPGHIRNIKGRGYIFKGEVQCVHGKKPQSALLTAEPLTGAAGVESFPAFSPDGERIAFSWNGNDESRFNLFVKDFHQSRLNRLTQAQRDDISPAWSHDGRFLAFLGLTPNCAHVYQISPSMGGEEKLAEVHPRSGVDLISRHLDWAPNGSLAVTDKARADEPFSIFRLVGDKKAQLTHPPVGSLGDSDPAFSPDGRYLAFVRTSQVSVKDIYVLDLDRNSARCVTSEHIYVSGLTWSADSRELVFSANFLGAFRLWRITIFGGNPEPLVGVGENAMYPHISKTGRLTYARVFFATSLWRRSLWPQDDQSPLKFITSSGHNVGASYSPDGTRIAFASDRSGSFEIWVCDQGGDNPVQITTFRSGLGGAGCPRWAPDSTHIVFDCRPEGVADIYTARLNDRISRKLTTGLSEDVVPSWSDNGIYFASNRSGDWQVWKMTSEGSDPVQLTTKGGFCPVESFDSKYVCYAKGRNVPGIWRKRLGTSKESAFVEQPAAGFWGYWAVVRNGIYFIDLERDISPPNVAPSVAVRFADLSKGSVSEVLRIVDLRTVFYQGLAVSPDRRYILYPQLDQGNSNIMVVDSFQ